MTVDDDEPVQQHNQYTSRRGGGGGREEGTGRNLIESYSDADDAADADADSAIV